MRLLVTTQAVDVNEPVLGFFHRWLEELAGRVESIEVICLKEGEHRLPANVRVHTLGKPAAETRSLGFFARLGYVLRFYALAWKLRNDYDTAFVHMNPEYVVLAGPFWHLWGKRIALWYNHPARPWSLVIAAREADIVFHTSPYAASAGYRHAVRMPAGIDTELFKPQPVSRDRTSIYMQGRVTEGKRVHVALAALRIIHAQVPATLAIVGPEDGTSYASDLKKQYAREMQEGAVIFMGNKRNSDTPALYAAAGVAVNLAEAGHFDKSALEPMACATPVIVGSPAFAGLVPAEWTVDGGDPEVLAEALKRLLTLPDGEYQALGASCREAVVRTQSLSALMDQLVGSRIRKGTKRAITSFMKVSVVLPVHNEAGNIPELAGELDAVCGNLGGEYEIIWVDDGSTDQSPSLLESLARKDSHHKVITFSRNFGQTAAMAAGIAAAKGDIIIPMDADGQNDPADIPRFLEKIAEGYDVVSGWRKDRKDKLITRKIPSWIANRAIAFITGCRIHDYGCSMKAYKRELIQGVTLYGEMHRFIPAYAKWQGGKVTEIVVHHRARGSGSTHYGISRTFKVLLDLIVLKFLTRYMTRPMHFFGGLGFISLFLSFLVSIWSLTLKLVYDVSISRTPLPVIAAMLVIVGVQLILMGVVAEMLMRIYFESQEKKPYVIKESANEKKLPASLK